MTQQMDKVTVVIPAHNEGENLIDTVHCVLENTAYPDWGIMVVDDASTDGSGDRLSDVLGDDHRVGMIRAEGVGVAQARNLGAACASGSILIFLDAHCYTPPHWMDRLIRPLADPRVGMVGPAFATMCDGGDTRGWGLHWRDASLDAEWLGQRAKTAYPVPLLGGACQVVRKADLERLGYYDAGMTRWGSEDQELCLRYWLMGYEVLVQPQVVIYHLFRGSFPYEVQARKILYNRLRLAMLHLSDERLNRVLNYHRSICGFDEITGWLQRSDVRSRRTQLRELRCRDDDWFCGTIRLPHLAVQGRKPGTATKRSEGRRLRQVDKVSIVIPALNEGENLVDTVRCVLENTSYPDWEIIVVDDGSTDGSSDRLAHVLGDEGRVGLVRAGGGGAGQARNLGATCASGRILIFLDAHCYTPPQWIDGLTGPLADPRVGMVGSALGIMGDGSDARGLGLTWRDASLEVDWLGQRENTPYPVPFLSAACQAVRKADLERLGHYDNGMTRYGSEDLELCLRYWLMGYEVLVQPQTVVYHLFRGNHPYEILEQNMLYNRLRMGMLHLSDERLNRVLNYHRNVPTFDQTMGWLRRSDVVSRRRQLQELRCRDDDWFCTRFDCHI